MKYRLPFLLMKALNSEQAETKKLLELYSALSTTPMGNFMISGMPGA